jgi:serine/threonine protein kinase
MHASTLVPESHSKNEHGGFPNMVATVCPSRETLLQYSLGKIPEEQRDQLDSHLDRCPDCQATIVTLNDADDTVIGRLRMPLSHEDFLAEPQLRDALAAALEVPERAQIAKKDSDLASLRAAATPRALGEYRVLEELGRGGMGRVYKALHTKLDRVVAIKVLSLGGVRDPKAVARFEREMKAVGRLAHRNIVQAYDAREIDNTPVLIMELIDGLDLAEIVRRIGRAPIADACELVRQTALALQCAHMHGLVHRDIKPSNIMLARSGEVKLLDLGLARLSAEGDADNSPTSIGDEVTGADQVTGTVDYMAPEQASDSRAVDIRADLYGLGCTLYKLVSGRVPFGGPKYRTIGDKLNAHAHDSVIPIRRFVPEVRDGLAAILDRLLAKNPDDRFATPAEVAEALIPWCAGADLPSLLRRADASLSSPLPPRAERSESRGLPEPAATARRSKFVVLIATLLLSMGGFALGILITIQKGDKETTVTVPEGSHTTVDAAGNVKVKLGDETPPTVSRRQVFIVGDSPYYQVMTDMAQRKGMVVVHSFNTQYDKWLPRSRGHLLLVEARQGTPVVPSAVLDEFFPGASKALSGDSRTTNVADTKIALLDFSRLLDAITTGSASGVSEKSRAFIVANSPYWQALVDMAKDKGMIVEKAFNCEYDEWLPKAKGHFLLVETHDGVPIVPSTVLDKFYPGAFDGLKTSDGVATVDATKVIFVDFFRLKGWF